MAYPLFIKALDDPLDDLVFTFSRGPEYPSETQYLPRQLIAQSESGLVRVATVGPPDVTFPLVFKLLPQADIDGLLAFLQSPYINWSAFPFAYAPATPDGPYDVRYAGGLFVRQQVAGGLYDVQLTLRVEATG